MKPKLKKLAVNTILVVVSTALCYLAIEFFFFKLIFTHIATGVRQYLPETPGVLVQTSKAGPLPRDYVAILGDSFAEGIGDMLLTAEYNSRDNSHTTQVIHELTGRDVVTFGRAGAGSAEAFVLLPTRTIEGSRCLMFPTIEEPRQIFAYYFEGNEIWDNLRFRSKAVTNDGRAGVAAIDSYLSETYGSFAAWRCHLYLSDVASRMIQYLYRRHFASQSILPRFDVYPNTFLVAGQTVKAPPVNGPGVEYEAADRRNAIEVFDRALGWLRKRFESTQIAVVYVPAPLSTYRIVGSEVEVSMPGNAPIIRAPAERVASNSDLTCALVREASVRHGVGFVDARPPLRQAAANEVIHGPRDWEHFNKIGYRVFGEVLARRLPDLGRVDDCK